MTLFPPAHATSPGLTRRGLLAASAPLLMSVADARAQGIAPKRGGTLTSLLTPEPPILVLGVNGQGPTLVVGSKIYQGLITYSPTLEPIGVLAKSWTISDDKLVYTFKLQEGVTFHDGHPFTAEDVVFSVMEFAMTLSTRARSVFSLVEKAEAPDPLTVRFTLKQPYVPFLLAFVVTGVPMVPEHIFAGTDYRANPRNATPIGTGPFRFVEWQRANFIRLQRYDGYWKKGQPYLDEIIFRIVPDSQSRALALQTGQVQLAAANDIEPFDVPRFRQQKDLTVTTAGWEYFAPMSWFEINKRVKPLDDKRVRQAMSMALDRKFIAERLWFNVGKPATGPLCATVNYYDPTVTLPPYDPNKAMALLDEVGLKPDAKGVRFTIKHLPLPYGEVWTRLSEYFRTSMQKIGIAVTMDSTDAGGWAARLAAWDFETSMNFVYQVGDPSYAVEGYFISSNIKKVTFTNVGGYANPQVDELFAKARASGDPAERKTIFAELQRILVDDMPYLYLMQMSFPTFHANKLQNVVTTGLGLHASFDDMFLA
jgi:peptide/nickel transport system substrate-binding protein